jgi:hypothetical protein
MWEEDQLLWSLVEKIWKRRRERRWLALKMEHLVDLEVSMT